MKKWTRILAVFLSLGILLSMAGCGSRAADRGMRSVRNADIDAISKVTAETPASQAGSWLAKFYGSDPLFLQTDLTLTADYAAVDPALLSMLTEAIGMDIQWLQSLGLSVTSGREGDLNRSNFVLRLNGSDIIQADMFLDLARLNMYLGVPELNPSYIALDLSEAMSGGSAAIPPYQLKQVLSSIDPKLMQDIILRYFGLMADSVDQISVSNGTVSASGVRSSCTVAKVFFGGEEILRIAREFLNAASTDSQVEDLVYQFMAMTGQYRGSTGYFHSSYVQWIQDALTGLEDVSPEDITESFLLTVYLGTDGKLLGGSVEFREDDELNALLSGMTVRDGDRLGVEVTIGSYDSYSYSDRHRETRNEVTLTGTGTCSDEGRLTGSFQMGYYQYEDWNGDIDEIDQPLFTVDVDGTPRLTGIIGDVVLTPTRQLLDLIEGELYGGPEEVIEFVRSLSLVIHNQSSEDKLDGTVALCSSGKAFLTLDTTASETERMDMTIPADLAEPEDWANSMGIASLAEVILRLRSAGMPIELLNSILSF